MTDKIKDEFISTLSHEIRTPLTSIKGFSKTMLDNWEALNDAQKKDFLGIIQAQSQRLINLVENVLNVSKIDSGANDAVLKKINPMQVLNSSISIVKMNYKDFEFNLSAASSLQPLLADNEKFQQVLINLLDNAAKYSKNSKKVDITLKNDKNFCIVSIKNYGTTIEQKYFDRIFDKFFRINSYLTNTAQGSGLGLYITKTLVEQMAGKIEVKSTALPPCTEFILKLPVYEEEKAAKKVLNEKN